MTAAKVTVLFICRNFNGIELIWHILGNLTDPKQIFLCKGERTMFIKYLQRTVFFMLITLGLICLPSPLSAVTAKNVEANAEPFQPDPKDSSFAFDCAQNILTPDKTEATDWKPDFPLPKQAPVKSSRGQYSVILLGKDMQDADKTQAIPLVQFLALGNVRQAPRLHKLCYFADLNGDGTLEIIAGERQGKGLRYAVYTSQGKCVIKVPDRTADKQ